MEKAARLIILKDSPSATSKAATTTQRKEHEDVGLDIGLSYLVQHAVDVCCAVIIKDDQQSKRLRKRDFIRRRLLGPNRVMMCRSFSFQKRLMGHEPYLR
jgi:hypothetical protein